MSYKFLAALDEIVEANKAFGGHGYQVSAAGLKPHVQLWNPVGSGKVLLVDRIIGASNSSGQMFIGKSLAGAMLLNLDGTYQSYNKNNAAIAATAQLRIENRAALYGASMNTSYGTFRFDWLPTAPIRCDEGTGVFVMLDVVLTNLFGTFEWREV